MKTTITDAPKVIHQRRSHHPSTNPYINVEKFPNIIRSCTAEGVTRHYHNMGTYIHLLTPLKDANGKLFLPLCDKTTDNIVRVMV